MRTITTRPQDRAITALAMTGARIRHATLNPAGLARLQLDDRPEVVRVERDGAMMSTLPRDHPVRRLTAHLHTNHGERFTAMFGRAA